MRFALSLCALAVAKQLPQSLMQREAPPTVAQRYELVSPVVSEIQQAIGPPLDVASMTDADKARYVDMLKRAEVETVGEPMVDELTTAQRKEYISMLGGNPDTPYVPPATAAPAVSDVLSAEGQAVVNQIVDEKMTQIEQQYANREDKVVDEVGNLGNRVTEGAAQTQLRVASSESELRLNQKQLATQLAATQQTASDEIAKEASDVHVLDVRVDKTAESAELARSMAVGMHTEMMSRDERIARLETMVQTNEHRIEAAMDALNSRITELAKETFTEVDALRKEGSMQRNEEFSSSLEKMMENKGSATAMAGMLGLVALAL